MFRINVLALAGAVIASTASIVAVSPALAADHASATVSYTDLDLGSAHGRTMLDRRIASAAGTVCAATNEREFGQVNACRRTTVANARDAIQQAEKNGVTTIALN